MDNKKQEKTELRPPYASSGQADQMIDLLRRTTPKKIDTKFIVDSKIATPTNAFRIMDLVKWLGVCNVDGTINNEIVGKLKFVGEERKKHLIEMIKKSYDKLFESVDISIAQKEDIMNFFVSNYGYGFHLAKPATNLFLHLCEKYGISLSEELRKKTHLSTLREGVTKRKSTQTKKIENKQLPDYMSYKKRELNHYDIKISEGAFRISIKGNGLDKSLIANDEKELDEAYEKFKDFINAAKLLFPENKKEPHQE